MAPEDPCLLVFMALGLPLPCWGATEYYENNSVTSDPCLKRHCRLFFSFESLALGVANCHVRSRKQPYRGLHSEELRPPANSHMNEPPWQRVLQSQTITAPANSLLATS